MSFSGGGSRSTLYLSSSSAGTAPDGTTQSEASPLVRSSVDMRPALSGLFGRPDSRNDFVHRVVNELVPELRKLILLDVIECRLHDASAHAFRLSEGGLPICLK